MDHAYFAALSIKELKRHLAAEGISTFGLIEKSEFITRAVLTGKKGTNQSYVAGGGSGGGGGGGGVAKAAMSPLDENGGENGGDSSDADETDETARGPCIKCPKLAGRNTGKPCGTTWCDSECVAFVCDKHAISCDEDESCSLSAHLCSIKCAEREGFETICPCGAQLCEKCLEIYKEENKEYDWSCSWREDCKHYMCIKCAHLDCQWCPKPPALPRSKKPRS